MLLPDKEGHGFIKPSWLAQDGRISAATRTATATRQQNQYPTARSSRPLGRGIRQFWILKMRHRRLKNRR